MEGDGRSGVSCLCDAWKVAGGARWTCSSNRRERTLMARISGKNPGSASRFSRRICVKKRGGSKRGVIWVSTGSESASFAARSRQAETGERKGLTTMEGEATRSGEREVTQLLLSRKRVLTDGFHQPRHLLC